jgi:hypothetical protein
MTMAGRSNVTYTRLTLHLISMGVLFVAATIHTPAMPELSCSELTKVTESALGYALGNHHDEDSTTSRRNRR